MLACVQITAANQFICKYWKRVHKIVINLTVRDATWSISIELVARGLQSLTQCGMSTVVLNGEADGWCDSDATRAQAAQKGERQVLQTTQAMLLLAHSLWHAAAVVRR